MPDLEIACRVEQEEGDGGDAGCQVAQDHDVLSVVPVHDGPGQGACEYLGDGCEEAYEGEGGCDACGLPGPDGDGELGHPCPQEGDELACPDDGEAPHARGAHRRV